MLIGSPKEIKNHEHRIGLVPSSVSALVNQDHEVIIEKKSGMAIGYTDEDYIRAGASIADSAEEVFAKADMIVKVKEPQPNECKMLRENQVLFTFLHLAPDPVQAKGLMDSKCTAIAYETVTDFCGHLPLLSPMSEVAGKMATQVGAWMLEKNQGGRGVLLGGVPGVSPAKVTILGGGIAGTSAAKVAVGMGADVTIVDINVGRLRELDDLFRGTIKTSFSTKDTIESLALDSDLLIGAVLVVGSSAPKLITRETVEKMMKGSVLVDIAIDQGGCFETSKPTTHQDPYYDVDGVMHYCVTNMPGAVARTSAKALNNVTLPYVMKIANQGVIESLKKDPHLKNGLNVYKGSITHNVVARDLKLNFVPFE